MHLVSDFVFFFMFLSFLSLLREPVFSYRTLSLDSQISCCSLPCCRFLSRSLALFSEERLGEVTGHEDPMPAEMTTFEQ